MVTLQDEWSSNLILPIGRSPSTPHGIYVAPVSITGSKQLTRLFRRFGFHAPFLGGDQHRSVKHLSLGPPLMRCLAHCILINESVA
jgi:hypothetical protein